MLVGAGGLLKYIGTCEGVEKSPFRKKHQTAVRSYLLCCIVNSGYEFVPGVSGISVFWNERLCIKFSKCCARMEKECRNIGKLVAYMAEHPKEMKLGRHGLFYQTDETIDLEPAEQIQAFFTDAKSTGVRRSKLLELK